MSHLPKTRLIDVDLRIPRLLRGSRIPLLTVPLCQEVSEVGHKIRSRLLQPAKTVGK